MKLLEWKSIEEEMKKVSYSQNIEEVDIAKEKWDSLFIAYKNMWNLCEQEKERYFLCVDKSDYDINSEPPPPPPPPRLYIDQHFESHFPPSTRQTLTDESKIIIQEYIKNNYPEQARKDSISCVVTVIFICNVEGLTEDISIHSEIPPNLGFGEVAVEAIKLARFIPATQLGKPVRIRVRQNIRFEAPKKDSK